MRYTAGSLTLRKLKIATFLFPLCLVSACAEFDQLMKPRVEGLQRGPGFDAAALREGGIGNGEASIMGKQRVLKASSNFPVVVLVYALSGCTGAQALVEPQARQHEQATSGTSAETGCGLTTRGPGHRA
jgi:hypothetical protein